MNRLECLSSEIASDSHDFPARRNKFPVLGYRESVATNAETLGNLGVGAARIARFR